MIINSERNPTLSLYYLGCVVLEKLQDGNGKTIDTLFDYVKKSSNLDLNIDFFYYALDWLFILSLIELNNGRIYLCE